jgi:hypothetical protein
MEGRRAAARWGGEPALSVQGGRHMRCPGGSADARCFFKRLRNPLAVCALCNTDAQPLSPCLPPSRSIGKWIPRDVPGEVEVPGKGPVKLRDGGGAVMLWPPVPRLPGCRQMVWCSLGGGPRASAEPCRGAVPARCPPCIHCSWRSQNAVRWGTGMCMGGSPQA